MKNFFGIAPGAIHGRPKDILHWSGIPQSIVDLSSIPQRTFAIADGIIAMESNGPIQGIPKPGECSLSDARFKRWTPLVRESWESIPTS